MIWWTAEGAEYRNGLNLHWWRDDHCGRSIEIVLYFRNVWRFYWRWREKISPHVIYDAVTLRPSESI